jgi:holliday junction DNA helicase RuvA
VISSVRGTVQSVGLDHAVIEVGGVGFAIQAAPSTLATLRRGTETQMSTALIVREDSLTLFGFADTDARDLFWLLLTVSGIGPRLGLAMLAVLEPDKLRGALSEGNIAMLTQVPGIGRKGAERLIIELRDKVGALPVNGQSVAAPSASAVRTSVVEALVGLGFPIRSAEQAVDGVLAENAAGDTAGVLRKSLAVLGRKR